MSFVFQAETVAFRLSEAPGQILGSVEGLSCKPVAHTP